LLARAPIVAGGATGDDGLTRVPGPDLDQVREELRKAIDRARLHLEWVEIALVLTQWRFEETTRQLSVPRRVPGSIADRPLSVLWVYPPPPPAPADSPDPASDKPPQSQVEA
jgi:hypothetical protein